MSKNSFLFALAAGVFAVALAMPPKSTADADAESQMNAQIIKELQAQQVTLGDNQKKIDEKLSVVGENLRLARAFTSRGK